MPRSIHALHLEGGAISRHGVRVLTRARPPALRTLSLARAALRGADLAPLFEWLQGGAGAVPGASAVPGGGGGARQGPSAAKAGGAASGAGAPAAPARCALTALNLRHNRLGDAGAALLLEALCVGGKAGVCSLRSLDLAGNQLTVGVIDHVSKLLSALTSLMELSLLDNAFVAGHTVVNGLRGQLPPLEVRSRADDDG